MNRKLRVFRSLSLFCLASSLSLAVWAAEPPAAPEAAAPAVAPATAEFPELRKAVGEYLGAWEKQDYQAMQALENWDGGEKLEGLHYMQNFDADFGLHNWEISSIQALSDSEYLVLISAMHNPPKQIAKMMGEQKTLRSVLRQYWRKEGDKYTHLFHLEKQRLMAPAADPLKSPEEVTKKALEDMEKNPLSHDHGHDHDSPAK